MNYFKKLTSTLLATSIVTSAVMLAGLGGNASALACYQYNANGFTTSTTPVFNNICGITTPVTSTTGSYAFGDETNFVRIRQETSTNPSAASNPALQSNMTTACTTGENFEIFTYIHNNAEPEYNNNGTGSAVATNVKLDLAAAGINTTASKFNFGSTVTASNAATDTNSTYLDCEGQNVKLTLVPSSVYYDNTTTTTGTYNSLPNTDVNSTFAVGSPVWPSAGQSGNEWGCWDYRIVVVYTVEVTKVSAPTTPTTPATPTTPSTPTTTTTATSTPTTVTTASTTPTTLVNTGPGSVIGIFAAVTAAGAVGYRWFLGRRLSRQ